MRVQLLCLLLSAGTICGVGCSPPKGHDKGDDKGDDKPPFACTLAGQADPDFASRLGCADDFTVLSSPPLVAGLPGARSVKTVIDRADDDALYFQNSKRYQIHWEFASSHLSGGGKPIVGELSAFNDVEYYSPDRRFVLGAVTYYEGPKVYVYEIAPYDAATPEMIAVAFARIQRDFYGELRFHPTSTAIEALVPQLPDSIPITTTDDLYAGIDYQPLNLAESYGRLRFLTPAQLEIGYVDFQDIVVLEHVPNDISVVAGTITQEFQTPLAHINVLAQNRGTPNMGLRDAMQNEALRALEGQWVHLDVGAQNFSVTASTEAEADAWFESHRPAAVVVPNMNLDVQELVDIDDATDISGDLRDGIRAAIPAFGGKASHFSVLHRIPETNAPDGFVVPVFFYHQFMTENGFLTRIDDMVADPSFDDDPATRDALLTSLREDMLAAPVNVVFNDALHEKLNAEFPGKRMRFRSSTNAEDLEGFTGAGLYTSKSGDPNDPERPVLDAVRTVWASVWSFRAFEERRFRGISHDNVGMALLVHPTFTNEVANGVALTANIFDSSGLEPGYYINVQKDGESVVLPDDNVTTDEILYQYERPGQPVIYYSHSSLVPAGETVLTNADLQQLGRAMQAIHTRFASAYGPGAAGFRGFYAMDIEFKFDPPATAGGEKILSVKQARPHPGRGQ